ncbi:PIN domain-containing protein [Cyanobacterium aponinum UTEX 3222]|uniref:type II toxin-antitoxin system VapC family toxin n=1 Tax=Cyanobacterium aponinum TaxID=379064 RepID=UPI002B4BB6AC|nr:PIN domain-containing protein [Cyanobacterium aponinum]WRL38856.1 PIN domain-containing protein [Cyanobacterium aponinum UTEX 3221]WRL40850.1 PIN domain-containing protein [Cyanobacterium aponinum UTEX 3222]
MIKAIIADTILLYALVDSSDQYYGKARSELLKIQQLKIQVIIPYPIALECYSLVLYRLGNQNAHRFAQQIKDSAQLIQPTNEDYHLAWQKIKQYSDQKITLFDAVTATISQRLNYPVWTYDYHFDLMSIPIWRDS